MADPGTCKAIVKAIVTSYEDLLANTTSTSDGTIVRLYCAKDHVLVGEPVVKCVNGEWDKKIGQCFPKVNGTTNALTQWGGPLTKENLIIILSVCCAIAFLILMALIFVLCLYRNKDKQLRKHKQLTYTDSMRSNHLEKVWPPTPLYPVSTIQTKSTRDLIYPPSVARWNHMSHILPEPPGRPIRLSQYPFYLQSYTRLPEPNRMSWAYGYPQNEYEKKLKRMSFAYSDSKHSNETELTEIKWDPKKMYWHDSFDYTRYKIPRPQVTLTGWGRKDEALL